MDSQAAFVEDIVSCMMVNQIEPFDVFGVQLAANITKPPQPKSRARIG